MLCIYEHYIVYNIFKTFICFETYGKFFIDVWWYGIPIYHVIIKVHYFGCNKVYHLFKETIKLIYFVKSYLEGSF